MARWIACLILGLWVPSLSQAGLIVTVQSRDLEVGQSAQLDVYVESDQAGGDPLNFFQYRFQITQQTGSGRLDFDVPDFNALANDPDYVFQGLGTPFGAVGTTNQPNDTFDGGDSRPDLDNTTVGFGSGNRKLLTWLIVTPGPGVLAPPVGSTFAVELVPLSGLGTTSDPTFFYNHDNGNDLPLAFSGVSGTVAFTSIPEPGSFMLVLLGAGFVAVRGARSGRIARPRLPEE